MPSCAAWFTQSLHLTSAGWQHESLSKVCLLSGCVMRVLTWSVVHPGVPQRSFVRLLYADWLDGGRCCFQLLPELNCEPVPVRVFFGVVNFRAMHSNIITQLESACLESIHCGFLVILCDLLVKEPKINMPLYSYSWRLKSCWLADIPSSKLPRDRYQKHYAWCWVVVKCVNKKTIPASTIKVLSILFWKKSGCECPVLKAGTFPITVIRKKPKRMTRWRCFLWRHLTGSLLQLCITNFFFVTLRHLVGLCLPPLCSMDCPESFK